MTTPRTTLFILFHNQESSLLAISDLQVSKSQLPQFPISLAAITCLEDHLPAPTAARLQVDERAHLLRPNMLQRNIYVKTQQYVCKTNLDL